MSSPRVNIEHIFAAPREQVFAFFAVHENLETIFVPARIRRIRDGSDSPDGLGSVRRMKLPLIPAFEETITALEPNSRIEYRITRGTPLNHHLGTLRFTDTPSGTRLHYTIELESAIPGVAAAVGFGLTQGIKRGLSKLKF